MKKRIVYVIAVFLVFLIRLIKPLVLVRFGSILSNRIGHFAANTELYLCEREAGINKHGFDIFCMGPACNLQLERMWKRTLRIWPSWIVEPVWQVNRLIPGWSLHEIGNNTQNDRDVHNLLEGTRPHLQFTENEEKVGKLVLKSMNIPENSKFVCLMVRDNAYLGKHLPGYEWGHHDYRDCDIKNYFLVAEELVKRGYYVIRMGETVKGYLYTKNPRIIDYAMNGMRSDFMDIYLGAKCAFTVSNGTGWDSIPFIFRRPIVYVSYVDTSRITAFGSQYISITKHHFKDGAELTLKEIFDTGAGFCIFTKDYEEKGVTLKENTPEEIRDVVVEMAERLDGTWKPHPEDEALQKQFWDIFPTKCVDPYQGRRQHGKILGRYGTQFLRDNKWWLNRERLRKAS